MMESCFATKPGRVGPVEVEDIKRDLLDEFAAVPAQDSPESQAENLQVYLRVRPFTAAESDNGESRDCVNIEGPDTVVLKAPRICPSNRQSEKPLPQTAQKFTFTQVFGPESSQRTVFDGSVRGLVRDVLQGGNCLVFTYGVTNAGKTFTFLGPDHDSGLLPRSLSVIFNSMEGRLYGRGDLKPQRCRDFSRLTPDQQAAENSNKRNLLRLKEGDKNLTSGRSAFLEGSSLSSDSSVNSVSEADSFCLDVSPNVRFSVWVSFCEIYNENIHDLLEQVPSGHKRTVLRLSQDVKGNSFIKDLRWVQVNSSEEAYRVMKIGKRNQSFSSTRLNHLSSRSHSIFSIRILRIDDVGVPRVLGISELALCDLAGSERCSRTNNTGERLKEAGNINSSLLTLGKCINAMRLNQNAKFQHHVPFRESKLTHFLQFFFCGAGRVSMVVNINQNSSCFDETLNVLKFSALAQKVVVLNSRPASMEDVAPLKAAMELSILIDEADRRRNVVGRGRKSSLVAWETSLEDVQEDEDGEEWGEDEEEEEESVMEGTVLEAGGEENQTMEEEEPHSDREAALRLVLEAQIREEVSAEFMELFNKMEKDYSERLEKEREILEERADKRLEILQSLVNKTDDLSAGSREERAVTLNGIMALMSEDLMKIREDAQSVHHCLSADAQAAELEALRLEKQRSHDELQEAMEKLSELTEVCHRKDDVIAKLQQSVETAARDGNTPAQEEESRKRRRDAAGDSEERGGPSKKRVVLEEEIWRLQEENEQKQETINELREREERRRSLEEELQRREEELEKEKTRLKEEKSRLEKEKTSLEEEKTSLSLEEEKTRLEEEKLSLEAELQRKEAELQRREEELEKEKSRLEEEKTRLEKEKSSLSLEEEKTRLEEEKLSLEAELQRKEAELQRREEELEKEKTRLEEETTRLEEEKSRLEKEKSRLEEELRRRGEEVEELKKEQELLEQKVQMLSGLDECPNCDSVFSSLELEQRETARLQKENKALVNGIFQLQTEATALQTELRQQTERSNSLSEQFSTAKSRLQDLENQSEEKSGSFNSLTQEVERLRQEVKEEKGRSISSSSVFHTAMEELKKESEAALQRSAQKSRQIQELQTEKRKLEEELAHRCEQLREELANQRAEFSCQLQTLGAELESEGGALRGRLEEMERSEEERRRLEREVSELRGMMSEKDRLLEDSCRELQQEKENEEEEERKVSVVEELKQEMQRLRERKLQEKQEEGRSWEMEAVKREMERLQRGEEEREAQDVPASLKSNMEDRRKTPRTAGRKRKSCEVEDLVSNENKRNKVRGNTRINRQEKVDGALQKIGELIHSSPSIIGSKAKTIMGLVSGHSAEKGTVATATKPRRGRKKLFKAGVSSPLLDSPNTMFGGAEEEKESDHLIIKRQLRSKTCRK